MLKRAAYRKASLKAKIHDFTHKGFNNGSEKLSELIVTFNVEQVSWVLEENTS